MAKWTGDFCTVNDGVEVGILHVIRWCLKMLYEAILIVQKLYNEIPEFEWWLKLPNGMEIKIVKEDGTLVSAFYEAIPENRYWAVKWTIFGMSKTKPLPKKKYFSFMSAVIAPWDVYLNMSSEYVRDSDSQQPFQYGLISDTISVAEIVTIAYFIAKALKDSGLVQSAFHFLAKVFGFIKRRRLMSTVHDIEDIVIDMNQFIGNTDTTDEPTLVDKLDNILNRVGVRLQLS